MKEIKLPPLPPAAVDEHNLQGGRLLYTHAQLRAHSLVVAAAVREACAKEIAACADEVEPEALFSATRRATFMEAIYAIRTIQIEESK